MNYTYADRTLPHQIRIVHVTTKADTRGTLGVGVSCNCCNPRPFGNRGIRSLEDAWALYRAHLEEA